MKDVEVVGEQHNVTEPMLHPSLASPAFLPVLHELDVLQACGCCTLRLAGVRTPSAYLAAPGTVRELLQAVSSPSAGPQVVGPATTAGRKRKLEEAGGGPAEAGSTAAGGAPLPSLAPCPLCLGILQGLGSASASAAACCAVQLATTRSSLNDPGGLTSGHPPVITTHVQPCAGGLAEAMRRIAAEWELGPWALQVSLPAAAAVRAQALNWRLRPLLGEAEAEGGAAATAAGAETDRGPVSLKEAVRLAYGARLEALLGQPQDQQAGLCLSLTAVPPPSAADEAAWLAASQQQAQQQRQQQRRQGRRGGRGGRGGGRGDQQQQQQQQQQGEEGGNEPALIGPVASEALVRQLAAMPEEEFRAGCPAGAAALQPPSGGPATVRLQASRRPIHVGGRYRKLRRGIPQSPWLIDGERKGQGSVQELLASAVLPSCRADAYTFLSAGREDIDVRMLGTGRPFILEITNARSGLPTPEACAAMEAELNAAGSGVEARGLRPADAALVARLKEGEQEKEKSYAALCWLPRCLTDADVAALESCGAVELAQWTPVRVLHRRANLERRRSVHSMRVQRLAQQERSAGGAALQPPEQPAAGEPAAAHNEGRHEQHPSSVAEQQVAQQPTGEYFVLQLRTQAGTYIKEFIHGDLGRTRPSLGDLLGGCQAQIAGLDVTEVHMEGL